MYIYLSNITFIVMIALLLYSYILFPLALILSVHRNLGIRRTLHLWKKHSKRDGYFNWIRISCVPGILISVFTFILVYTLLFILRKDDWEILIVVSTLITSTFSCFLHTTVGELGGIYGSSLALIILDWRRRDLNHLVNQAPQYFSILVVCWLGAVVSSRVVRGLIKYNTLCSYFKLEAEMMPLSLLSKIRDFIVKVGRKVYSRHHLRAEKGILQRYIVKVSKLNGVFFTSLQNSTGTFSLNLAFTNMLIPLVEELLFAFRGSEDKPIARIYSVVEAEDLVIGDYVSYDGRFYRVTDLSSIDSLDMTLRPINEGTIIHLKGLNSKQQFAFYVKFPSEIMDNLLTSSSLVTTKIFLWNTIDNLKLVNIFISTNEFTTTKMYTTFRSTQRAFDFHDKMIGLKNEFDASFRAFYNRPVQIHMKFEKPLLFSTFDKSLEDLTYINEIYNVATNLLFQETRFDRFRRNYVLTHVMGIVSGSGLSIILLLIKEGYNILLRLVGVIP